MDMEQFIREKVKCCACEGSLKESIYINGICLDKLAPWNFPVWGNILVKDKHPENRAVAVICDKCLKTEAKIKFAVEWDTDYTHTVYHPIEQLKDLPPITEEEVMQSELETRGFQWKGVG